MGNQPEQQQYKKPQVPPGVSEDKDNDFKKQGVDKGAKTDPRVKDKPGIDPDDDTDDSAGSKPQ